MNLNRKDFYNTLCQPTSVLPCYGDLLVVFAWFSHQLARAELGTFASFLMSLVLLPFLIDRAEIMGNLRGVFKACAPER